LDKRVLIIGNNPAVGDSLNHAFSSGGLRVFTASDGIEGLFQFGVVQPHIVILDVEESDTLRRLRSLSAVPIIVLADEESGLESINLGADFFVAKPPNLRELSAKVRATFRRV
jgi:DNA-binding response OmpR family regulator